MYMKELTIQDIETIVHRDENRVMAAKETTGRDGRNQGDRNFYTPLTHTFGTIYSLKNRYPCVA